MSDTLDLDSNPPAETTCRSCGRPLRNPKSVSAGIGPECARRRRGAIAAPRYETTADPDAPTLDLGE